MANKDQFLLEQLYEKISVPTEPTFVRNQHVVPDPREGSTNVMNLMPKQIAPEVQHMEAAKEIIKKILKEDPKVNKTVLKRDNFGNVNFDGFKEMVNALMKIMADPHHKDNPQFVEDQARRIIQNFLPKIEKITNRLDYNSDSESSNATAYNNANVNSVPGQKPEYTRESTANYLSEVLEEAKRKQGKKKVVSESIYGAYKTLTENNHEQTFDDIFRHFEHNHNEDPFAKDTLHDALDQLASDAAQKSMDHTAAKRILDKANQKIKEFISKGIMTDMDLFNIVDNNHESVSDQEIQQHRENQKQDQVEMPREIFSTLSYLKTKKDPMNYSNLMEKSEVITLKQKPNVLNYIK
jgi:hypothetical protein